MPRWTAAAAWTAVLAALPTVVWRILVGFGLQLGTPAPWRANEHIPGTGTAYVSMLSAVELLAAILTLRLACPGGDRIPGWSPIQRGRRLPATVVCVIALSGVGALVILCALSVANWSAVNPFAGEPDSHWSRLCTGSYLCALVWPPALLASVVGYAADRRRSHA
jgi:hypothetical protein